MGPVAVPEGVLISAFGAADSADGNLLLRTGVRELKSLTGTEFKVPAPCEAANDACNTVGIVGLD